MSPWSLVSVRSEDGSSPCVAASSEGRLTSIPTLEGYADVADVLAAWSARTISQPQLGRRLPVSAS